MSAATTALSLVWGSPSSETFNMYFDWDATRQFEPGTMSFTPAAVN
jgi:hypothetical protein